MKKLVAKIVSIPLKWIFKIRYFGKVKFGKRIYINHRFKFQGKGKLFIGNDVNLWAHEEWNRFQTFDKNAVIKIGDGCRLNGATIQSKKSVVVGKNCLIGSAMIIDTDFHSTDYRHRNDPKFIESKSIVIGDDVWVAGQSAILKGVHIGDRSVIGFKSLVTKDIPKDVVAAGNPATVVKNLKYAKRM
jgi:maltose O-acetyltransferase